ncbi:MAG: PTS sugar transporter subunit IIB [bacterium]|nr:PTS sugar transporter subunit IIB [bacterium]
MIYYRIDDRLVHGQVIVGWIRHLTLQWLTVVDEEIDENQKMIMNLTVPEDVEFKILNVADAKESLSCDFNKPGMVLVKSPREILRLQEEGLKINKVHLGGLHFIPGRDQFCEYIFLSRNEVDEIREIIKNDTSVIVQALPSNREIPIEKLIQK